MSSARNTKDDADDHEQALLLVHALADGELDPMNASAVEQRIAAEPALARELARIDALRRLLREPLARDLPPPGLEARVRKTVGLDRDHRRPTLRPTSRLTWQAMAAAVVLAVGISSGSTWFLTRQLNNDDVAEIVVAGHLRSLMASQPIDVASSDRHTVKPWFAGRIPNAPKVVELEQAGFQLVGGRIDVVHRAGVSTLVYRIRAHVISVTEIPVAATPRTAPVKQTMQGYNVVSWTADGTTYWAVSDVNIDDLENFAQLFRDAKS